MKARLKGKQWEITYRCPGYKKAFSERFATLEEAEFRIAEINRAKALGELRPPEIVPGQKDRSKKPITVAELMDEYVQLYGLEHWGDSYLSYSRHRIEHYIKPYLGDALVKDLTTHDLDLFYSSLRDKPAVVLKGHKRTDKTVSAQVVQKVHDLLRNALNKAVAWGYIPVNPALNATTPKYISKPRGVWTPEQVQMALSLCDDPILHLAILLAMGCSMRIGEILGLTWDCVDISPESIAQGTARVHVNKQLKRCDKRSLADLGQRDRDQVLFTFPERKKNPSTTSLVLKTTKTESSVRTIFLPDTVTHALQDTQDTQEKHKGLMGEDYTDFNLVLAHEDGRPYEERQIADKLRSFIKKHDLPPVVFHSLRHSSVSVKLEASNGNIKAVQGDTGHAQARMVTELYAHTNDGARRKLAQKVEQDFFRQSAPSDPAPDNDLDSAIRLMKDNPELAKLLMSMAGKLASA